MPSGEFHQRPDRSTRSRCTSDRTGTAVHTWTPEWKRHPCLHFQAGGNIKLGIPSSARWGGLCRLRGVCRSQRPSPLKGSSTDITSFCCCAAAGLRCCATLIPDHQWLLACRHVRGTVSQICWLRKSPSPWLYITSTALPVLAACPSQKSRTTSKLNENADMGHAACQKVSSAC